jgi:polyhydroxybutyrate depolymerase
MPRLRQRAAGVVAATALAVPAIAITGAGPSSSAAAGPRVDPASGCRTAWGRTLRTAVNVPGEGIRTALVRMPAGRTRGRLPLVIGLHGAYGSGAFMERYSGLSRLADRYGFAVAYPDARGTRWTLHPGQGLDDVAFINVLLDRVLAGGCVSAARVYVAGVSNGGGLAALLGCESSGRLAAIAAVAGGYGDLPECKPDHPLSVLEIHGTADAVVPYHAARGDVLEWLRGWVARDGCRGGGRPHTVAMRVNRFRWAPCNLGTVIEHFAIDGGQHAWPGAEPPDPGPRVALSAAEEAWRFFAPLRRAGKVAGNEGGGNNGEG